MDLHWGQPSRRVCWLIQPTSFDYYLPEDHTLEWVFCEPYGGHLPPQAFFQTIDQEEAERYSKSLYMSRTAHVIVTRWRNPEGFVVRKMPIVKRWKEHHLAGSDLFGEES